MSHLSPRPSLESDDRHLWSERNNLKLWMTNSFLSKCMIAHSVESAPQFSRLISVIQIKLGIISLQARYLTSSVIPIIDFPLNIANFRTWKPKTIDIIFNAFNLHKVCHTQASLSAYRDRLWVAICDSPFVKCLVGESLSTEYVYWVLIGLVKLDYHIEMIFLSNSFICWVVHCSWYARLLSWRICKSQRLYLFSNRFTVLKFMFNEHCSLVCIRNCHVKLHQTEKCTGLRKQTWGWWGCVFIGL